MPSLLSKAAAAAFVLGLAMSGALAQSLILRPAAVPLKGAIGQGVTQTLTLQNETDQAMEFDIVAQDVVVRDGKRVFVEAGRVPGSIAATAVVTPARLRVQPRGSASASVVFTLPQGMQHRAVVALFRSTTPVQSGARKAYMSLGTLFTFAISDQVSVTGRLEATPPTGSSNAAFSSTLANDGSEPVVPTGVAVVMDAQGKLLGKSAFNVKRLLPGESATLHAEYAGELAPGNYRAVATFDLGGRPLSFSAPLVVQ